MAYGSRSLSRDRSRSRSRTPYSADDYQRSPARSSRQQNGSRRFSRTSRRSRSRSYSRSLSPLPPPRARSPEGPKGTKVVVEKLTKNVNENHLREIFGVYGTIRDFDMPMNRHFMTNRGTAYILYEQEADAEAAIAHMHEAHIDGALINVSIVLPRRKFSPPPPTARRGANFDPREPPVTYRDGRGRGGMGGRRRSPLRGMGGAGAGGSGGGYGRLTDRPTADVYRPRSISRSRSPPPLRRQRTRSPSYSRSPSPPRRRRDSPDRGGYRRRRSPSYSSYDSYDDRSRSRSPGRDRGRGRR